MGLISTDSIEMIIPACSPDISSAKVAKLGEVQYLLREAQKAKKKELTPWTRDENAK